MGVGPVDVVIIGFPGNKFTGQIAPALMELVESGTIRVIDLLFVMKDEDGVVTTHRGRGPRARTSAPAIMAIDVVQPGALGDEDAEEVGDDLPLEQLGAPGRLRERLGRAVRRRRAARRTAS